MQNYEPQAQVAPQTYMQQFEQTFGPHAKDFALWSLPTLGGMAGGAIAGPYGSLGGAGMAGALSGYLGSPQNPYQGALKGGLLGLGGQYLWQSMPNLF